MKIPQAPPLLTPASLAEILADVTGLLLRADASTLDPDLHWDDLRRRPVPSGIKNLEIWWATIQVQRASARRPAPWQDATGRSFGWRLTDHVLQHLRLVDTRTAGTLSTPSHTPNSDDVRTFLRSSLDEEAIHSSILEGAATTRDQAKALLRSQRPPRTRDERMIVNNHRAMLRVKAGIAESLTPAFVVELQQILTEDTLEDPGAAGRYRTDADDIVVVDEGGQVLHRPPPATTLADQLEALCTFLAADDVTPYVHPVLRAIIGHFWLAWLHPFVDGNGRTARAIFYWTLLHHGYWLAEHLPISRVLARRKSKYARAFLLVETDNNDLTYFLHDQLDVLRIAIADLDVYVANRVRQHLDAERSLRLEGRVNHRQLMLIEHARRHPEQAWTIAAWQQEQDISYPTAREDLLDLARRGVLVAFKRSRAMVFRPVDDLTEALHRLGQA